MKSLRAGLLAIAWATGSCDPSGKPAPQPVSSVTSPKAPIGGTTQPRALAPTRPKATGAARCPPSMALLAGGDFWMGSAANERFSADESPRYQTKLADFCLDQTEVTVRAYAACVEDGACAAAQTRSKLCNASHPTRTEHPINCVTFAHAEAFCRARGARLPTEVEWEYAARGGSRYQRHPWGDAPPDGRTCWKQPTTCPVKAYGADAFGVFDLTGNVWEWTETWYAAYPWPPEQAFAKVYRGGGFSRRFEKWLHTRLRNRSAPGESGAHLGFRCAQLASEALCPFGSAGDGRCRHGVLSRECPAGTQWNGARCALPNAPRCGSGRVEKTGFGCVLLEPETETKRDLDAEARQVRRERTPENDADCRRNQRDRWRSFRYSGAGHDALSFVARRDGCKNRDVGVGWNSTCCP